MFYSGNPFLPPLPAFPQPVSPPDSDPDEGDQVAICFGRDWLPYVLGALASLVLPTTWEGDADAVLLAQYRSALLLAMVGNPEEMCAMECVDVLTCVNAVQERYDPETGAREISTDGGETWEDGTSTDPRFVGSRFDDITGSCAEANSIVRMVQESVDQTIDNINAGLAVVGIVTVLVGLIATVLSAGAAAPLAIGMIAAITAAGTATVSAALTNAVWEEFRCIVYCEISGATEITPEIYEAIRTRLTELGSAPAELAIWQALTQLGPVGIQNAATLGMSATGIPADCDDCDCSEAWCYDFTFAAGLEDWTIINEGPGPWGVWEAGSIRYGDTGTGVCPSVANRRLEVNRNFTETTLTRVVFTWDFTAGGYYASPPGGVAQYIQITTSGGAIQMLNCNFLSPCNGAAQETEWTGEQAATGLYLRFIASIDNAFCNNWTGNARLLNVRVEGTGANPFGEDNC